MSASYSIVQLARKDAGALAALEALCFPAPWSEELFTAVLPAAVPAAVVVPVPVFGARDSRGELLGYISLGVNLPAREAEVYNLAVHPDARRRKLGGSLLAFALRMAAEWGIVAVFLEVRETNAAALGLYGKHGFRQCGLRKGYYADTGESALVMRCDIQEMRHEAARGCQLEDVQDAG